MMASINYYIRKFFVAGFCLCILVSCGDSSENADKMENKLELEKAVANTLTAQNSILAESGGYLQSQPLTANEREEREYKKKIDNALTKLTSRISKDCNEGMATLKKAMKEDQERLMEYFAEALQYSEYPMVIEAAMALGFLKPEDGHDLLSTAAGNFDEPKMREAIVIAMGDIHDKESVGWLILLLEDTAPIVQAAAIKSLGKLGVVSSFKKIMPFIKSQNFLLANSAMETLGKLGNIAVKKGKTLAILYPYLKNSSQYTKQRVLTILGKAKDRKAVKVIIPFLHSSHWILRKAAVKSLKSIGTKKAWQALHHIGFNK